MEVAERVKLLLSKAGISQKEFAEKLAISPPRLNNYLSGRNAFSQNLLVKISELTNSELSWLLTGQGSMYIKVRAREDHTLLTLPVLADIAAGIGIEAEELEPTEYIHVDQALIELPGPYYCFKVAGRSMEPELYTGDYAIISRSYYDVDYNGRICAFRSVDGLLLKRVYFDHRGKRALLIPINPRNSIMVYDENSPEIIMIGILAAIIRKY
ncbi:MAG: XRE family transcriptional regulator [Candidatus Cloacimonetes bacterium]|nr:XRE family transcriptional regulator [Candidatus Cloacimonadota bacterium]